MRPHTANSGFTLIELLVTLTIIGVLIMTGIPSFSTYLRNSEIRSTAESIVNGLRLARVEAVRLNANVAFTFVNSGTDSSWSINRVARTTLALVEPPIQSYTSLELGSNTVIARTPDAAVSVVFDELGRVESPSPLPTPGLQQIDIGTRVAMDARPLRIIVDRAQGIRMCDPSPALAAMVPPDARAC
jgi:type IV fimbrial biogenesis protein FimT